MREIAKVHHGEEAVDKELREAGPPPMTAQVSSRLGAEQRPETMKALAEDDDREAARRRLRDEKLAREKMFEKRRAASFPPAESSSPCPSVAVPRRASRVRPA